MEMMWNVWMCVFGYMNSPFIGAGFGLLRVQSNRRSPDLKLGSILPTAGERATMGLNYKSEKM